MRFSLIQNYTINIGGLLNKNYWNTMNFIKMQQGQDSIMHVSELSIFHNKVLRKFKKRFKIGTSNEYLVFELLRQRLVNFNLMLLLISFYNGHEVDNHLQISIRHKISQIHQIQTSSSLQMKSSKAAQMNGYSKSSQSSQSRMKHSVSDKRCSPKVKESKNDRQSQKSLQMISNNTPKAKGNKKPEREQDVNQQEKKNFLPGQKYKTPDEQSGALAFYKSLYEQNPRSQIAIRYCVEYGVLEYNEAKSLFQSLSKVKASK